MTEDEVIARYGVPPSDADDYIHVLLVLVYQRLTQRGEIRSR